MLPLLDENTMDADFHLRHKALYVEPMRQPIKWDRMPADGNEYIHRVRAEAEVALPNLDWGFCPAVVRELEAESITEGRHLLFPQWKRNQGYSFCNYLSQLALQREYLMKKFPKKLQFPPLENEKEVCLFLLGSKFCNELFSYECDKETAGHAPLLSVVLHFAQDEILTLLKYLKNWINLKDKISYEIGRWMYVLLLCLHKPISKQCEEFLEELYDECAKKNNGCEEKNEYNLLNAVLYNGFALKSHKITNLLRSYSKLRYRK